MPSGIYKHKPKQEPVCPVYKRIQEEIYKQGKTVKQMLSKCRLNAENWLVKEEDTISVTFINRTSGKVKVVLK